METSEESGTNNKVLSSAIVKEGIYYRDPDENSNFLGPFDESRIQWWYRQGFFHSGIEFRMGRRGDIYRLDRLRELNGIACPFSFLIDKKSKSELEEIISRFREQSKLAQQVIMMMREENDHMKGIFQKMDKKFGEVLDSQRRIEERQNVMKEAQMEIDSRLDELEEHHVNLAERAEEWLMSMKDDDGIIRTAATIRDKGETDTKLIEEIRRVENQVIYLNQERVKVNKRFTLRRMRDLESSAVSMPWVRKLSIPSEESDEATKERLRKEKRGRQLMWNSCQMLGHGSALINHGSRAPKAQVKALRKTLLNCDRMIISEIARDWNRFVDFGNAKCLFCRCALRNASDFMEHLINGPHMSILQWCNISSECLNFFMNQLKDIDSFSDQE